MPQTACGRPDRGLGRSVCRIERETPVGDEPTPPGDTKVRALGRPSQRPRGRPHLRVVERGTAPAGPGAPAPSAGAGLRRRQDGALRAGRTAASATHVPLVRFEGVPGEFSQHDFGQVVVRYLEGGASGSTSSRRGSSTRAGSTSASCQTKEESLVRSLIAGFENFGGVPLVAVFDNPKTVTLGREGRADPVEHAVRPGGPRLPLRAGAVHATAGAGERRGREPGRVRQRQLLQVRRFHDRADLETQLAAWHLEVNTVRPCRATGVPPATRIAPSANGCGRWRSRRRSMRCASRCSSGPRGWSLPGLPLLDAARGDR